MAHVCSSATVRTRYTRQHGQEHREGSRGDGTSPCEQGTGQGEAQHRGDKQLYLANVILCAVILLLFWVGKVPILLLGFAGGATLFMVAGYVMVQKEPYTWSLLIACIWTGIVALRAYTGNLGPNLETFLACTWTLGCWIMVPTTKRVKTLLAQHPDLWVAKKMADDGSPVRKKRGGRGGRKRR